ncbi:uncharacterized protein PV09_01143 [Verruconis gallopava]|uniref:Uncharacterized protein n=1 Tax=Verruconis gallopava TaxID=253628 RepID=A0A0D2ANV3_9PEZI|nr:uncharacterized protein PV09_01143 [Verruconis gallopava]KIW08215.1 hypothetical protein PV09_01143 [Verruconis gallopava]
MANETPLQAISGISMSLLIVSAAGWICLVPGLISVWSILVIKVLHILNSVCDELQAQSEKKKLDDRQRAENHARLFLKVEQELKSAIFRSEDLARANQVLTDEIGNLRATAERDLAVHNDALRQVAIRNLATALKLAISKKGLEKQLAQNKALKTCNAQLAGEIDAQKRRIRAFEVRTSYLEHEKESLKNEIESLEKKLDNERPGTRETISLELPENIALVNPLSLHPEAGGFTCIGLTQRNRRCQNRVALTEDANGQNAVRILQQMRSENDPKLFKMESLHALAKMMLCKRWHREGVHDNSTRIARGWVRDARETVKSQTRNWEREQYFVTSITNVV